MEKHMRMSLLMICCLAIAMSSGCRRSQTEISLADPNVVSNLPDVAVSESSWPWWRGTQMNGVASGPCPPTEWSEDRHVKWRSPLPGQGHATPTVWEQIIFLATADANAKKQSLIAVDRSNGQQLWQTEIHSGGFMSIHTKNSHASATPACDGSRVFCAFMVHDGIWVTATDLAGEILWQTKAGEFKTVHGYGSSPVIYRSLVLVVGDSPSGGFLAALHRETGDVVWRVTRRSGDSYGSPLLTQIAGQDQLLISGHERVISYAPDTGKELWDSEGPATTTANTMAVKGELVFASGGYPQTAIMAIQAGTGNVVWQRREKVYVPSLLVFDDKLVAVQDNGIVRCLDLATGEPLWTERLPGNFSASPVRCGDLVYVTNESGVTYVFQVLPEFQLIAKNTLGNSGFASPVILDGQLYLRTGDALYCIESDPQT